MLAISVMSITRERIGKYNQYNIKCYSYYLNYNNSFQLKNIDQHVVFNY